MRTNIKFRKVYCEISNTCNLKCDFCPQSSLARPTAFMTPELFRKIVAEVHPFTNLLCLHVMGEPLFHPDLALFLDICQEYNQGVSVVTNGVLLNEKSVQSLLNPSVHQVNFSLQSFENNYQGMDNQSYLNRIFKFTERAFKERPDMHINYRLWNANSFEEIVEVNKKTLDKVREYFKLPDDCFDNIKFLGNRIINNLFINLSSRFDWPSMDMPFQSTKGTCKATSNQLAILADGTVIPCCLDREGVINLGNCNEKSILEILNDPRALAMYQGFKRQELVEEMCQRCTYIERFNK
jgi:radical SAM protein with 4Fe4S-binding SPASM domain